MRLMWNRCGGGIRLGRSTGTLYCHRGQLVDCRHYPYGDDPPLRWVTLTSDRVEAMQPPSKGAMHAWLVSFHTVILRSHSSPPCDVFFDAQLGRLRGGVLSLLMCCELRVLIRTASALTFVCVSPPRTFSGADWIPLPGWSTVAITVTWTGGGPCTRGVWLTMQ